MEHLAWSDQGQGYHQISVVVFYLQHYYLGFTLASKMKVSKDVQHTLWLLACLSDFLGVTIDNSLSWKQHVNILSSSLGRRAGVLARLRHILPQHCLGTIYNTTIQPSKMIFLKKF